VKGFEEEPFEEQYDEFVEYDYHDTLVLHRMLHTEGKKVDNA